MPEHQREVDQLEWVCFPSTVKRLGSLTFSNSELKSLVTIRRIDNTTSLMITGFTDAQIPRCHPLPNPSPRQTQRKPSPPEEERASGESYSQKRQRLKESKERMKRRRRRTGLPKRINWTVGGLTPSEASNGSASPSPSSTTKIYANISRNPETQTRKL